MRDLSIEFGAVGFATLTPQAEAALRRLPLEARSHLRGVLASGHPRAHAHAVAEARERNAAAHANAERVLEENRRLIDADRPRLEARRLRERALDLELRSVIAKANGVLRDLKRRE